MTTPDPSLPPVKKGSRLYLYVLIGVVIGSLIGWLFPEFGSKCDPIAKAFIALIKMMIGPIIFCTVVHGIAGMSDMRALGRVGGKAFIYFEVVSSLALVIGLCVANLFTPGAGFHVDPATLSMNEVSGFTQRAADQSFAQYALHIIPKTFFDAFTGSGDVLQILLIAILFGVALAAMGERGRPVHVILEVFNGGLFGVVNLIMKLAPIGAGAAMAFTLGKYGVDSLKPLVFLMFTFYVTCAVFIFGVLGLIARFTGFSLWRFLVYIKDELMTVLGTSSSETALVPLMEKLQRLGCSKSVVGVVVPAGYSFNLDGTNIYLTLAALFVAQALDIPLTLTQELTILGVAMLTSKGASGVTGAGFVTLAATLAVVPDIPVAGLALILGVDRFMSEMRALTNFIGNGVATIVVSRWEKALDLTTMQKELTGSK